MSRQATAKVLALSLLAFALLAAPLLGSVALANDSSIGTTGGSVYPIWTTDVRLAQETVQATCFGAFAEYRVDFRFVNEGIGQKVKLGFPFTDTVASGESGVRRPIGFQAWRNGKPLTVRAVPAHYTNGKTTTGYFVHEAYFPRGATTITVSYLAEGSSTAMVRRKSVDFSDPEFGLASWYDYWLHTGATWKGSIGESLVRYRLADSFRGRDIELRAGDAAERVPVTAPEGWTKPLPRTYQWRFVDFDPERATESDWWKAASSYDVTLGFAGGRTRRATNGRWTWSSVAAGYGDKHDDSLQDGSLVTCWAEGAAGAGTGEWVEARFKRPQRLRELRIMPGNNYYPSAFAKYARPKTLTAVFSDGNSMLLHLKDAPTLQRFPVKVKTRTVRFVVESVYPGTDYPATCISEVEFGTERAPGYAPFRRLLNDPDATGRLTAWAGPAAPAPSAPARTAGWQEERDAELSACGDLMGFDSYVPFPADEAPFKEPASLADITQKNSTVCLPDAKSVGRPAAVNALSYWTYEIRYKSGVDLLVNTRLSGVPHRTVLAELVKEAQYGESYEDGRRLPFDLLTVGDLVVGVARPGKLVCDCCDCSGWEGNVPGQVFWRDGDTSYHLYARSDAVTADKLVAIARSLIEPVAGVEPEPATQSTPSTSSSWQWWVAGCVLAGAVAIAAIVVRRRRTAGSAPPHEAPQ